MTDARHRAEQVWHDASGQVGAFVIDAVEKAIAGAPTGQPMPRPITLTATEARVLWTVLGNSYAPGQYHDAYTSAMKKLCQIGGGYACRDCSEPGPYASRFGGFVCKSHKAKEDGFLTQEAAK